MVREPPGIFAPLRFTDRFVFFVLMKILKMAEVHIQFLAESIMD
jgi:hypothetical protein